MKKILIYVIQFYKGAISPFLPPACRFYPSCSQYSMESIQKHGAMYGVWLSIKRIVKCHPFHPGGVDPVK